jgi:hypothetical protein
MLICKAGGAPPAGPRNKTSVLVAIPFHLVTSPAFATAGTASAPIAAATAASTRARRALTFIACFPYFVRCDERGAVAPRAIRYVPQPVAISHHLPRHRGARETNSEQVSRWVLIVVKAREGEAVPRLPWPGTKSRPVQPWRSARSGRVLVPGIRSWPIWPRNRARAPSPPATEDVYALKYFFRAIGKRGRRC